MMSAAGLLCLLSLAIGLDSSSTQRPVRPPLPSETCQPITGVTMCLSMPWQNASFPNIRGHVTQEEADNEVNVFLPLVWRRCSNAIVHFLCAVYTPFCVNGSLDGGSHWEITTLRPCREVCEYVRRTCEPIMVANGFSWPVHFECANFSSNTSTSLEDVCLNIASIETVSIPPELLPTPTTSYTLSPSSTRMLLPSPSTGPTIEDFNVMPKSFLGLETSCPASDPYDNFILICTASKPAIVIPDLTVVWYHNGSVRNGTVSTENNGTYITNTLRFPNSSATDSGTYRCQARLDIPDSPSITLMEESIVTVRPQRAPYSATGVTATVGETTANITFTIPAIAYTPEYYSINFTGLELQNTLNSSTPLSSSSNISTVDNVFQITLTGLEEANTYNYTIVSTNCIGSTSTDIMNFTTLPAVPVGVPLNCSASNIQSNSVVLQWNPPVKSLQNGPLVGYSISCYQQDDSTAILTDMNTTLTTLSLSSLTAYTSYTCNLSAINIVGTGPSTQCTFTSGQDRPDDSPQDFTSTPTKNNVTFSWRRPAIPNGVITQYNLTVVNLVTSVTTRYLINVAANQETVTKLVGFEPYQNYTATVTASTVIGYGPVAITEGRTDPDIASPVSIVTIPISIAGIFVIDSIPSIDDTTVNLTWTPPNSPNGHITGYNITVLTTGESYLVTSVPSASVYSYLISGLISNVAHTITIGAVNELGQGDTASVVTFSKPAIPTAPPGGVESVDKSSITVSWDHTTFNDIGAFFVYRVTATPITNRRRQSGVPIERIVPHNETSITLMVDTNINYGVTVAYVTSDQNGLDRDGPTTNPVTPGESSSSTSSGAPPQTVTVTQGIITITSTVASCVITPSSTSSTLAASNDNTGLYMYVGAAVGLLVFILIVIIVALLIIAVVLLKRTAKVSLDIKQQLSVEQELAKVTQHNNDYVTTRTTELGVTPTQIMASCTAGEVLDRKEEEITDESICVSAAVHGVPEVMHIH